MYGAVADWCQELAQRVEVHSSQSTVTLVAKVENDLASQVPSEDASSLTKGQPGVLEPEETWCGNTKRSSKIFQKIFKNQKLATDFMRNVLDDNYLWQFPMFIWKDMTQHAHVENIRILEVTNDLNRKDLFEANTKMGPILEVIVTKHVDRYGIEIKIDSMKKGGGTQSWVVTSRGVDKNVMGLAVDRTKPIHYDEASSSTEKFVAIKQYNRGQTCFKRLHLRHQFCRSNNEIGRM